MKADGTFRFISFKKRAEWLTLSNALETSREHRFIGLVSHKVINSLANNKKMG